MVTALLNIIFSFTMAGARERLETNLNALFKVTAYTYMNIPLTSIRRGELQDCRDRRLQNAV